MSARDALRRARLAGIEVTLRGAAIHYETDTAPAADLVEALRRHKPEILRILAAERCESCHGPGTVEHPLLEASYAGHSLLLHAACVSWFLESDLAASDRFEPQRVADYCDLCGEPGELERVTYLDGPIGGTPVHRKCMAGWFARLDAIDP